MGDKKLKGTAAKGSLLAEYRGRHQIPSKRIAEYAGSHLTFRQAGSRKIPEWALSAGRFIDGFDCQTGGSYFDQEGEIGSPDELAFKLDLTIFKQGNLVDPFKGGLHCVIKMLPG